MATIVQVGVVGINHEIASLEELETVAIPPGPYVALSTCNRIEIYFSGETPPAHPFKNPYVHYGADCFNHLARVTAGLNSAEILETEIQGQVKQSYESARQKPLPSELHFLFQKSLKIGKEIRSALQLCPHLTDTESTILTKAQALFTDPSVLFVGASEINKKILCKFHAKGLRNLTLINRCFDNALPLGDLATIQRWDYLQNWHHHDLIIFGTKSPKPLLTTTPPLTSPKFIVDLGVPRNVALTHPQITLANIESLHQSVKKERLLSPTLISRLDAMITAQVSRQLHLHRERYLA